MTAIETAFESHPRRAEEVVYERPLPIAKTRVREFARRWRRDAQVGSTLAAWENFVFAVDAGAEAGVLRLTELQRRTSDDIKAELSLLMFLSTSGLMVPRPLRFGSGHLIESSDIVFACVFSRYEGRQISAQELLTNMTNVRRLGELIGELHRAMSGYVVSTARRTTWLQNPLLRTPVSAAWGKNEYLLALRRVAQDIASITPGPRDYGIVHADFHGRNVLRLDTGRFAVIDFDDACYHWLAYDLAVCLNWLFRAGGEYSRVRSALLAGYERKCSLSGTAERVLDRLAFLRNALDYKLTLTRLASNPAATDLTQRSTHLESRLQWQMDRVL